MRDLARLTDDVKIVDRRSPHGATDVARRLDERPRKALIRGAPDGVREEREHRIAELDELDRIGTDINTVPSPRRTARRGATDRVTGADVDDAVRVDDRSAAARRAAAATLRPGLAAVFGIEHVARAAL